MLQRSYVFSQKAEKQFSELDNSIKKRMIVKLDYFCSYTDPLQFAKKLSNYELGEYRFRVGDYRIIFDIDKDGQLIIIALIGHRREIYL